MTTKTFNNHPYFLKEDNASIVVSAIYFGRMNEWFYLIAFVVMPDHLHLIVSPLKKNISQIMHSIKSFSSKEINRINKTSGSIWQSSFRDITIATREVLVQKINYIHENPIRKGIVLGAEAYCFSSANQSYQTDLEVFLQ